MAFPTQLFHTPLYHQEQLLGHAPGRWGPLRARLWGCRQSLEGGRGAPQESGVLSSLPGGQGRPHSEGKERMGQEVASPQPGPVCSSPPKGGGRVFQPLRDPAGSSPQGLGAVTSLGISSFYDLPTRPPSDAEQPPLAACSVGVACSQPLWNATATRTPLPRPQAPRHRSGR